MSGEGETCEGVQGKGGERELEDLGKENLGKNEVCSKTRKKNQDKKVIGVGKTRKSIEKQESEFGRRDDKEREIGGKPDIREEFRVSWWNGGGKMMSRITVNPELKQFLDTKPDIFVYGEAQVVRITKEMSLEGYNTIIHKAGKKGPRRGMVIFYKKSLAQVITKLSSSKKYDILWLRMNSSQEESLF